MKKYFLFLVLGILANILSAQEVTVRTQNDWGTGRYIEVEIRPSTNIVAWQIVLSLANADNTIINAANTTYTFADNQITLNPAANNSNSVINSGSSVVVGFQIAGTGVPAYVSHNFVTSMSTGSSQYWDFSSGNIFTNPDVVTGNVGIGLEDGETPSYKLTVKRGSIGVVDTVQYPQYSSLSFSELRFGQSVPAPTTYTSIKKGELILSNPTDGSLILYPHKLTTNVLGSGSAELNGSSLTLQTNVGPDQPISYLNSGSIKFTAKTQYSPSVTIDKDEIIMSANVPAPAAYTKIKRGVFSVGAGSSGSVDIDVNRIDVTVLGGGGAELTGGYLKLQAYMGTSTVISGGHITATALTIDGKIEAEQIEVKEIGADYVFAKDYKLMTIAELDAFIKANNHLPGIAPAFETEKGVDLGEWSEKLLEKIEELTLYTIQLKKELENLKETNSSLQEQINSLK